MDAKSGTELRGRNIAVLMTDGVEQVEYTRPREFLEEHGAKVTLLAPKAKGEKVQGFNGLDPADRFAVEQDVREARARFRCPGPAGRRSQSRQAALEPGVDRVHSRAGELAQGGAQVRQAA